MTKSCPYHPFDVTYQDARSIQESLRERIVLSESCVDVDRLRFVGGVDVAFVNSMASGAVNSDDPGNYQKNGKTAVFADVSTRAVAAVIVYDIVKRQIVETAYSSAPAYFPYVPGYLSFREGHAVLRAIGELSRLPEVIIYDGCGIAHPRGLGLASHMGLLTGIPSVGCAKSRLCGTCDELGIYKGAWTDLVLRGVVRGCCLRTRKSVKPVYVSPGVGMGIENSRQLVDLLAHTYRLPKATRLAHKYVTKYKKHFAS